MTKLTEILRIMERLNMITEQFHRLNESIRFEALDSLRESAERANMLAIDTVRYSVFDSLTQTVQNNINHSIQGQFDQLINEMNKPYKDFKDFSVQMESINPYRNNIADILSISPSNRLQGELEKFNTLARDTMKHFTSLPLFTETIQTINQAFNPIQEQVNQLISEMSKHKDLAEKWESLNQYSKNSADILSISSTYVSHAIEQNKINFDFIDRHRQEIINQFGHLNAWVSETLTIDDIDKYLGKKYKRDIERQIESVEDEMGKLEELSPQEQRTRLVIIVYLLLRIYAPMLRHGEPITDADVVQLLLDVLLHVYIYFFLVPKK